VRLLDPALAEEEGLHVTETNVFAYVMSCLAILTLLLGIILASLVVNAKKTDKWCWARKSLVR
jgi:hypothetical protein